MKIFKKSVCIIIVTALLFSLSGCFSQKSEQTQNTNAKHFVTDHLGNKVEVPNDVKRIAVCDIFPLPSVLTVFFDSASKIVAMAPASMAAAKNGLLGEIYPDILKAETGFMDGTNVNIEELTKLNPDVVFYSASNPKLGEQLFNSGFAAVAISANKWNYNCIETLNNWISLISEICPDNKKAEKVKEYSQDTYKMVQDKVKDIDESKRQRAFFLFQYTDSTILTSGKQFFGQWWADAIGAVNVAEELSKDNSVSVNMEQIYKWNPSLMFITNFTPSGEDDIYNNTIGNYNWSEVDAVKNKNVHKMPLGMYRSYTPGVDTPITLMWLAKSAYPELFKDIDITSEAKQYYKEIFNIELTDKQINSIFAPVKAAAKGF